MPDTRPLLVAVVGCCTVHLAVAAAVITGAAVTAAVGGWVGVAVAAALAMPVVVGSPQDAPDHQPSKGTPMNTRTLLPDAALSVVAGYAGTKAMEPVSMKLYELESDTAREREDAARPGPPYRLAAEKISSLLGLNLDEDKMGKASMAMHYGLAVSWAPLYPLLRRHTALGPVAAGLATGAAMSAIADELMTPALGFSAPNRKYPLVTHARGFVAHLAFGLAVAATVEAGWALLRHRP